MCGTRKEGGFGPGLGPVPDEHTHKHLEGLNPGDGDTDPRPEETDRFFEEHKGTEIRSESLTQGPLTAGLEVLGERYPRLMRAEQEGERKNDEN